MTTTDAGAHTRSGRPTRDHPTRVTYAQLAFWAWFLYAFGATQALLRDEQGTSRTVASLHGTAMAVGGLIGALLAARAISRWGRGAVLRFCSLMAAVFVLVYTVPGAGLAVTLLGVGLACVAGTTLMIGVNAFLLDHQRAAGAASLTEANALASLAGLLAPLVVGVGAALAVGWRAGVWITVVGLVAVEIWRGRRVVGFGAARPMGRSGHEGRMPAAAYWSTLVIMLFLAAEFCMTYWGADLLRERCGFGPAAAAASLGAITGGMLVGRIVGARLTERLPAERLLRDSIVVSVVGFFAAWSFSWWPAVVVGLFATGVGLSVQWPLGVARIVRASGGLTDRASAAASIAGSVAMALAPFALGLLSDTVGFHRAFLLVPAFLVVALLILWRRPVTG